LAVLRGFEILAKRPRYSRWRRLPQVFRSGEFKLPDTSSEPQRLTVYLAESLLDTAEAQAKRAGVETVQQYCAEILTRAIEGERLRAHMEDVEARNGPLEGLSAIANDPEYLAEWSAQAGVPERPEPPPLAVDMTPTASVPRRRPEPLRISVPPTPSREHAAIPPPPAPQQEHSSENLSAAARVVLFHAGQMEDDPSAFLPSLRRGISVAVSDVADLARALQTLEAETHGARVIDRRVAFALHRLAYEGQILHTDAWPGVLDEWTVDALRAVQEAVERILSGQDIRYYPSGPPPEDAR
jgi:hypothetical protein